MRNVRADRHGLRAYIRVGSRQREKRFPFGTAPEALKVWLDTTRAKLRAGDDVGLSPKVRSYTLADAVPRYFTAIQGMPSLAGRRHEIKCWLSFLGDKPRGGITRLDVLTVLNQWRAEGKAGSTLNHRRFALQHLYNTLDGPDAYNPCRHLERFPEAPPRPQAASPELIVAVAAKLTGKWRARFMLLAASGRRPSEVCRTIRTDITDGVWQVRTGKGGKVVHLPLTADLREAVKAMDEAAAWGGYNRTQFRHALYAAGWPRAIRPYTLRHAFGRALREAGHDLADVQDLMGHTDPRTTRQYLVALPARLRYAMGTLEGRLRWQAGTLPAVLPGAPPFSLAPVAQLDRASASGAEGKPEIPNKSAGLDFDGAGCA